MAQVAESLGVTTMALYRYLAGKDELLALMSDAEHPWLIQALGAIPRPCAAPPVDGPPGGGDRGALAAGAQRGQGDRGCRSHGTPRDAGRCAERWRSSGRAAGPPPLLDYDILLRRLTDPDEHPEIAAALAPGAFGRPDDGGGADQPYDVRFGLALFLDGVQALIDRVSVGAASVPPGTTEDVR